jgi:hypothetical protein
VHSLIRKFLAASLWAAQNESERKIKQNRPRKPVEPKIQSR